MMVRDDITGVILCGGDARRMSGVEKALQLLDGVPLVHHVRSRLAPQVGRVIISANRQQQDYRQWVSSDDIIADQLPGLGPLGGLSSAMPSVHDPMLFSCPGDAPYLHATLVRRLAAAVDNSHSALLSVPHDGARVQNLFLCMRREAAVALSDYLASGGRSVHGFIDSVEHVVVDASDISDSFLNINTPDELHVANAAAARAGSTRDTQ